MNTPTQLDRRTFLGAAASSLLACRTAAGEHAAPPPRPRLGINLSGPADYGSELPFVDVFRCSREWTSQREGKDWGAGPPLALDERGWVKRLEPGATADAAMLMAIPGHVPGGEYAVFYEGDGKLGFWGGGVKVISSAPGRARVQVDPGSDGVFVKLQETNPRNYVRNIRVVRPGFEATFRTSPWNPRLLQRWRGMAAVRFMDLQITNDSKLQRWSDRPTPEQATFSGKGVAIELLVDLANRLEADPWFCIPHLADDDFVHRFATLVRERLDPKRVAWIEYSNEVWNGMFQQHHHAAEEGQRRGLGRDDFSAAIGYTAQRSLQVFQIWEQVWGGTQRLCRVLPSWAANTDTSRRILEFKDAGQHADALAIAPYLSMMVPPEGEPPLASTVARWSLDQLFDHLERQTLPESVGWMKDSKSIANRHGVRLVAYEGGQHLVGVQGAENDETLTRLFHAANADPRMGQLYGKYLAAWAEAGGDLFCHFSSVSPWSKFGSWGLLRYDDEPERGSPKLMAVTSWGRSLGQHFKVPQ